MPHPVNAPVAAIALRSARRPHAADRSIRAVAALLLATSVGLSTPGLASAAETQRRPANAASSQKVLLKPIGIKTAGPVFTPLIPAGHKLPLVFSQTFGNETNGQSEVLVELSQKSAAGMETIASLRIKIPPATNGSLNITVTLEVSETKMMSVKTTVAETASTQRFGPFAVE